MENIENYLQDGANYQARATLVYLQGFYHLNSDAKIARWENCREQGYIVSLRNKKREQLNVAFFEHRNSDSIHAVKWYQESENALNIDSAKFGNIYKNKYDTSHSVGYGEVLEMAEWIIEELKKHDIC